MTNREETSGDQLRHGDQQNELGTGKVGNVFGSGEPVEPMPGTTGMGALGGGGTPGSTIGGTTTDGSVRGEGAEDDATAVRRGHSNVPNPNQP
jgi:hypothetical protein